MNEGMPDLPGLTRSLLIIKETAYRATDRMLWRITHPNEPIEQAGRRQIFRRPNRQHALKLEELRLFDGWCHRPVQHNHPGGFYRGKETFAPVGTQGRSRFFAGYAAWWNRQMAKHPS